MRMLCLGMALLLPGVGPAAAGAEWLESGRLGPARIRALCEQASDVRHLARMQMIAGGNARWRRQAREELVVEAMVMGGPPLDPERCYLVARAGARNAYRRAFEVRDFAVSGGHVSVFVIGRDYDPPPEP